MATLDQPAPARLPEDQWPGLKLDGWGETYATLHMWTQIVGKTRLALAPMLNHWWQVPLYVTSRGLTTMSIPYGERTFEVDFDFVDHNLIVRTSDDEAHALPLIPRTVADFYREYMDVLRALGLEVEILARPVEVEEAIPFAEDTGHASYDDEWAHRFWRALVQVDRVLKEFRGRFIGKASPVHFFWGGFDLAVTRFSGRRAPEHPGNSPNVADWVMKEAYTHEVSSSGFWPGSGPVPEPAFYSYAYPEPDGYAEWPVRPEGAYYHPELREFILTYDTVRTAPDPDRALMQFLESTYDAAAERGGWDRRELERQRAPGASSRSGEPGSNP